MTVIRISWRILDRLVNKSMSGPSHSQPLFICASDHNTLSSALLQIQMSAQMEISSGGAEAQVSCKGIGVSCAVSPMIGM